MGSSALRCTGVTAWALIFGAWLFAAAILSATPVAAQLYVEPEVQVQMLSEKAHPPVAEDEASIMSSDEFYTLRSKVFSVEEVAAVRIVFKGKWFRSADYLAREKTALLGANTLVLVESTGREEMGAGATMTYRAFRLTNSYGRPLYTKPAPDPPPAKSPEASSGSGSPFITPKPAETASTAPPAPPRKHRHFDWVWIKDASVLSHRLGFDASRATKDELVQLKLYVRENFSVAEQKKLVKTSGKGSKVVLDFVKGVVE